MFEVGTHVKVIANTFGGSDECIGQAGTIVLVDQEPYDAKTPTILVEFDQGGVMPFKTDELRATDEQVG